MKSEKVVLPALTHVPGPMAALKLAGSQSSRITTCLLSLTAEEPLASSSASRAVSPSMGRNRIPVPPFFLPCDDRYDRQRRSDCSRPLRADDVRVRELVQSVAARGRDGVELGPPRARARRSRFGYRFRTLARIS